MKHTLRLTTILMLLIFFGGGVWGQTTIYSQSFETDQTGYSHTPSQLPDADPGDQYFYRAEPSNSNIYEGSVGPYTNVTDDWLFVGSNPNTINSGNPGVLSFSAIDVSSYTDFEFYADFGAVPNDWDDSDDLRVEYNFDGGSWQTLFSFEAGGDGTNEPISLTGNASGGINTANGTTLTYDLNTIASNNFSGSGSSLNIRIVCDADANYEAFGVDNIIVKGVSGSPTPTISVNPSTLSGFTYLVGDGPSEEQSFTVEGTNLSNDITISPPTNYEISTGTGASFVATNPVTLTQSSGSVASTPIYVRLKAGLSAGTYNSEVITCSSTGASNQTVTCDGEVTDGSGGGTEDFANFPETSTSYNNGTFTGQDGSTWTYTQCAGGSSGNINPPTPYFAKGNGSEIYSGTISDGIGTLSFDYMQVFSTDVNLNVLVNDNIVATVTSNSQSGITLSSGTINVNVSGSFILKFDQVNTSAGQVAIDNVTWTGYSGGGNTPPTISNITQTPASGITPTTTVSVSADVTDADGTVAGVELHWGTTSGSLSNTISMSNTTGDTYLTDSDIPAQSGGTTVYYEIHALDDESAETTSAEQSYSVLYGEPSNHPTGFGAVTNSSAQITLTWTDATGTQLPEAYLVKASVDPDVPAAPVDGTPESDGTLVKNVAQGTQEAVFSGLNASTTYNFSIWPYTNSGSDIDYKTDGTVPDAQATTQDPPATPDLIISEVTDPADEADAKYIELYNSSASSIDLTGWQVRRYANGSTTSSDVDLSGTVDAGQKITIAYNTTFDATYGFSADIYNGFISGNGNDVYELFDGSNVVDIYGEVGVDGTGEPWEYTDSKAVRKNIISTPNATWTASEWNIVPSCATTRMTPGMYPVTTWNGTAAKSNDWSAEGNWDNGLPGAGISVFIPSGLSAYPTVTSASTTEDIVLAPGATLLGQENLTVNGTATIQTQITGYTNDKDGWNIVTTPVNGMAMSGSNWVPVSEEDDFYAYDEGENLWRNYLDPSNPSTWFDYFDVGTGYMVAYHQNNDGIKSFTGDLNADESYTINLSYGNTGWNLAGNPYPSKVNGGTMNLASSMKLVDPADGSYDDVAGDVAICQGFFVYAEGEGAYIATTRSNQTHGSVTKAGDINRMKLIASTGVNQVHTWIVVDENSTQAYEWQADSRFLAPITDLPRLSMVTNDGVKVSTYAFSMQNESVVIPLSFQVLVNESVTFSLENFSTQSGLQNVILEDTENTSFTTLSDGETYTCFASTGDDPKRFRLHIDGANSIREAMTIPGLNIYTHSNILYLNSEKELSAKVEMCNVTGQRVFYTETVLSGLMQFNPQLPTGWYIVKVISTEGIASEKVFIK